MYHQQANMRAGNRAGMHQQMASANRGGSMQQSMTNSSSASKAPPKEQKTVRLFVGSIPSSATEKDVRELFEKYGEISDLYYNNAKNFAFVKYPASGADKAQMEVHGMTFKGKTLNVHNAVSQSALFVGDLPRFVTNKMLWDAFAPFGDLERAVVARDDRDQSLRWGIVEFKNRQKVAQTLGRFQQGALLLMGRTPCPIRVEPFRAADTTVGVRRIPEQLNKEYSGELSVAPRLITAAHGAEFELAAKWFTLRQDQMRRKQELLAQFAREQEAMLTDISSRLEEDRLQREAQEALMQEMQRQEELRMLKEREMHLLREADEMRKRREATMMMMGPQMAGMPVANGMGGMAPAMMGGMQQPMQAMAMAAGQQPVPYTMPQQQPVPQQLMSMNQAGFAAGGPVQQGYGGQAGMQGQQQFMAPQGQMIMPPTQRTMQKQGPPPSQRGPYVFSSQMDGPAAKRSRRF